MMPRRAHQTEYRFPGPRRLERLQRRPHRGACVLRDLRKIRRVRIKILRLTQPCHMIGRVRAQNSGLIARTRFAPDDGQLGLAPKPLYRHRYPLRPFGMSRLPVTAAPFVRDDFHGLAKIEFRRFSQPPRSCQSCSPSILSALRTAPSSVNLSWS